MNNEEQLLCACGNVVRPTEIASRGLTRTLEVRCGKCPFEPLRLSFLDSPRIDEYQRHLDILRRDWKRRVSIAAFHAKVHTARKNFVREYGTYPTHLIIEEGLLSEVLFDKYACRSVYLESTNRYDGLIVVEASIKGFFVALSPGKEG